MKSNKFLRIALIALLCMAMLFTTACTPANTGDTTTEPSDTQPQGDVEVPVEDGKVTFYFTLGADSPAQQSFASYFLTGGCTGWCTGNSGELEFKQLNDSNVYYCITDVAIDPTAEQGLEYSILVGYNATSGMAAAEQGVKWDDSRKSNECAAYAYPSNAAFEWAEGQNKVNLGTHTFGVELSAPKTVNTTLRITFTEALPEGCQVAMFGSMNNWGNTDINDGLCEISEDRMSATLELKDALVSDYEFKAVVYAPGTEFVKENQWNGVSFTAKEAENGNGTFSIKSLDEDEYIDVVRNAEYQVPSGITTTLRVNFDKELAEGSIVHIYGSFEGWAYSEGKCEMTSTDGKAWTIVLSNFNTGDIEFKILVFAPGATAFDWGDAIATYGNEGNNITFTLTADHDGQTVDVGSFTVA